MPSTKNDADLFSEPSIYITWPFKVEMKMKIRKLKMQSEIEKFQLLKVTSSGYGLIFDYMEL